MNAAKIAGIVLIAAGVLGLAYGGFSYTRETHRADLGPVQFEVRETERVQVPVWLGVGAVALGVVLLVVPRR